MKNCPLCQRTYSDEDFNYCPVDGAVLPASTVPGSTALSPSEEIPGSSQYILEDVILPRLGEAVSKAKITKWHKKVGEAVRRDEPLYEISTGKVDAEIPSPYSGILFEIRVSAGQTASIGTLIARIGRSKNDE